MMLKNRESLAAKSWRKICDKQEEKLLKTEQTLFSCTILLLEKSTMPAVANCKETTKFLTQKKMGAMYLKK